MLVFEVTMAAEPTGEIRPATEQEFDQFVTDCKDPTGWTMQYEKGDDLKVWDQKVIRHAFVV